MQILRENRPIYNLIESDSLVLDIETTGVSRRSSLVVVASTLSANGEFTQIIINSKDQEVDLLKALYPILNQKTIYSYNGTNFDLPFLKARCLHHGLEPFEEKGQVDLYRYLITNKAYTNFNLFSLQNIELEMDIDRFEKFEKSPDIDYYMDLLEDDFVSKDSIYDFEVMKKVALHNKYDVVNTEKLISIIRDIERSKTLELNWQDFEGLTGQIENIFIDKTTLIIDLYLNKEIGSHFYHKKDYELNSSGHKLSLRAKVIEGYLDQETLGFCHILDHIPNKKLESKYIIPPHILAIYDGKYHLDSIKYLITYILKVLG